MINPPDKSESQNQANENPVDSKFTRDALEKPLLQLRIKKDDGSERVKVPLQRELNADEAILPEVNNVLERLRLDFDLFEPLRKMLELDVNFFALRGMPENTEYLYLHL